MKIKFPILLGAIASAAILGVAFALLTQDSERRVFVDGTNNDYRSAEALVRDSEIIFVGEFVSEVAQKVEILHPTTGPTGNHLEQTRRTFAVKEVVKGKLTEQQVDVLYTTRMINGAQPALTESYDIPSVSPGKTYVLFLRSAPQEQSQSVLSIFGEPSQAQLDGTQLTFQTSKRYQEDLKAFQESSRLQGLPVQVTGTVPFLLDLSGLRTLARTVGTQPALPLQPEPTPGKNP